MRFKIIAVVTLALGIGANTTIFSLVNALMLRPPPFPEAGKLVYLSERMAQLEGMSISYPNLLDWQTQNVSLVHLAGFRGEGYNLTGGTGPERVQGLSVSANFFSTLGVSPLLGRVFATEEDRPGAPRVAVISEGLWERRFGGEQTILGRTIELDTEKHVVIGIMPASFQFPREVELWTPLGALAGESSWQSRGNHPGIYGIARLKPGVTLKQAQADLDTVAARLAREYPATNTGNGASVMSLRERMVREVRPALVMLFGAVGFVLLIACANLANLLLARFAARGRELAIRAALGASRAQIIRQLLRESLGLSGAGAGGGLVLAWWGMGLLRHLIPAELQGTIQAEINLNVLAFTAGLGLLTGLGFGLVPAWQSSRPELNTILREGGRGAGESRKSRRLRQALVVCEMALAMVLLVGASLLVRSLARVSESSPGLDPVRVWSTALSLPVLRYPEERAQLAFFERLLQRLAASPGVAAAAATGALLGGWQTTYLVEGKPPPTPGAAPLADFAVVSPDYFKAMRIRLVHGRVFSLNDSGSALPVGMIDEKFAMKHWPHSDPVGQRISTGDSNQWMTIVGVVAHVKNYGIEQESREEIYVPMAQHPMAAMTLVVQAEQGSVAGAIRATVREIDPDQPMTTLQPVERLLARQVAPRRMATLLLGVFSALALGLAALGIYGVVSYATAQRSREIGLRLALGARPFDVLSLVLRQSGAIVVLGMCLGLAGAMALTRLMSSLVFGITATDPLTYLLASTVLLATGLAACYFPARRAAHIDPMQALRDE